MKKTSYSLLLLILLTVSLNGQNKVVLFEKTVLTESNLNSALMNNVLFSNILSPVDKSFNSIKSSLGQPTDIVVTESTESAYWYRYTLLQYPNMSIEYYEDEDNPLILKTFVISGSEYSFTYDGLKFELGIDISTVRAKFPNVIRDDGSIIIIGYEFGRMGLKLKFLNDKLTYIELFQLTI